MFTFVFCTVNLSLALAHLQTPRNWFKVTLLYSLRGFLFHCLLHFHALDAHLLLLIGYLYPTFVTSLVNLAFGVHPHLFLAGFPVEFMPLPPRQVGVSASGR
jgi:hypothetical protein